MSERRELIIAAVKDLARNFVFYDRKDDEELPSGEIENAIIAGEITIDEIVSTFREAILFEVK